MSRGELKGATRRRFGLGLLVAVALSPMPGAAQDIEMAAQVRGLQLPQAYYDRVAADPTAFTLPNGLFRTSASGAPMAAAVSGTQRLLVVPALFADSEEPHITAEQVQQSLFDGPAERGTVTDAYL